MHVHVYTRTVGIYMYMHACFDVLQFVTWLHIQIVEMLESGNEELQHRGKGTCIWYTMTHKGLYYVVVMQGIIRL